MQELFGIERDQSNPLWDEYIEWINENSNRGHKGNIFKYYYSDGGISDTNVKGIKIISLEEWDELYTPKLPEIFGIERDQSNPLWNEYIKWLGEKYNITLFGDRYNYYCYNNSNSRPIAFDTIRNDFEIITLQEWDKLRKKTKKQVMTELPKLFGIRKDQSNPLWVEYIEWINLIHKRGHTGEFREYYYSDSTRDDDNSQSIKIISLEEWKRLVKYEFGYIAPYDMFNGNIKKGDIYIKCAADYVYRPLTNKQGEMTHSLPSEIVCGWEKTMLIESKKGDYIFYGNRVFLIEDVVGKMFHLLDKENQPNQLSRGVYQQPTKQQIDEFKKDNLPDIGKYKGVIDREKRTITYGCQTHSFEDTKKFIDMFTLFIDNQEDIDLDEIDRLFKKILEKIS